MSTYVAGVDEVGRGPLAGPVIAAAVILEKEISGVKDSKKLSPAKRETLAQVIQTHAIAYAFGRAEPHEIDTLNIHHATLLAMKRAIENLAFPPHEVWVDGKFAPQVAMPCQTFIGGDDSIYLISAASILAKVHRDTEMIELDALYPEYGFKVHKGYPTPFHKAQLIKHGPSPLHRRSFGGVNTNLLS